MPIVRIVETGVSTGVGYNTKLRGFDDQVLYRVCTGLFVIIS